MSLSPEQFDKLVTKVEFNELKKQVEETNVNVKQILTVVDGIAKSHEDFNVEMAANQGAHDRMSETIANHEIRIKKLEPKNA